MSFAEFGDNGWVKFVLKDLNPSMQALRSVVRQNSHLFLREDSPVIDLFVDVVHRATGHCLASDESLFP